MMSVSLSIGMIVQTHNDSDSAIVFKFWRQVSPIIHDSVCLLLEVTVAP